MESRFRLVMLVMLAAQIELTKAAALYQLKSLVQLHGSITTTIECDVSMHQPTFAII
jgi:hypothetical protein